MHGGGFDEAIDLGILGILPVRAFDAMLSSLEVERGPVEVDIEDRDGCEVVDVLEPSGIGGGQEI